MTDIQIWRPQPAEVAQYEQPSGPLDDWIRVADQVVRLSEVIANSPFVPNGLRGSVPATAAAILTGRELGLPPLTSLANIHVIQGKPGLSALVMRALILSKGHEWQDVHVSDEMVRVRGRRRGEAEWTEASFTAAQARAAHIQLGGYPQDKLYARASARLARRKFADVIAGMPYSIDELEDGLTDEDSPAAEAAIAVTAAAPPAVEAPKPKTAQRKQRTQTAPPAAPPAAPSPLAQYAAGGAPLPPLPGEDEDPTPGASSSAAPDGGSPRETAGPSQSSPGGSASSPGNAPDADRHRRLVGVVHAHFKRLYPGGVDDAERLVVTARLANVGTDLQSSNELSEGELSAVADTLARCRDKAALEALVDAAARAERGTADGEVPGA